MGIESGFSKTYDCLIKGGLILSGSGIQKADVGVKEEQILSLCDDLSTRDANRVIDASGKYVIPGVIDAHVHSDFEDDLGGSSFTAAYGGVTTLIHFAYAKPGMKLIDTIKKYQEEGSRKSYLDFGIHLTLFDPTSQVREIPKAFESGVTSFKMFMTYAKLKRMTDDYQLTAAMDRIAECGGLAMVHAENGLATDYLEDRALKRGEDPRKVFLATTRLLRSRGNLQSHFDCSHYALSPLYCTCDHGHGLETDKTGKNGRSGRLRRDLPSIPHPHRRNPSAIRRPCKDGSSSQDRKGSTGPLGGYPGRHYRCDSK